MRADAKDSIVCVFGGSGFLGSHIVTRLAAKGMGVRVATRHPSSFAVRSPVGEPVPIEDVYADVRDETSVKLAIEGCDAAVNAVGLYVEHGASTFEAVHEIGALNVARQAAALGLGGLVHISGIGAHQYDSSRYIRARGKSELLVRDAFERSTILRPSALFGRGGGLVDMLTTVLSRSPVFPLFDRGQTRLQPVFVEDVAEAVCRCILDEAARGKTYELGGPQVYSYRDLVELLEDHMQARRWLVPVPYPLWDLLAAGASILPRPPLTRAQVRLMKDDNVVSGEALTFEDLGVTPKSLKAFLEEDVPACRST